MDGRIDGRTEPQPAGQAWRAGRALAGSRAKHAGWRPNERVVAAADRWIHGRQRMRLRLPTSAALAVGSTLCPGPCMSALAGAVRVRARPALQARPQPAPATPSSSAYPSVVAAAGRRKGR
eukprot:scaffold401_cov399-Prasinococcus_capsulatus_cf.AAC.1